MVKLKKEKDTTLRNIKRAILLLLLLFFIVLIFLLLLPKKPDIIKGVTYDLKYPKVSHYSQIPRQVFENDFKLMKEAGINTIRLYGMPPEFLLDLADKYNIKVIETVVFPGDWTDFNSPYQLQALKREAIRNMTRDMNRECIYAWSIWNDAPWTYGTGKGDVIRNYGKEKVSAFLKEIYEAVKKHDPLRPVTAATLTIDEDAKSLGADFLDILGYNEYLGISDWRNGCYDPELAKKMVDELAAISKKYKKPVFVAETGCSTYWTTEIQEDVIADQIAKVDNRLLGIVLFQWADDWSKSGDKDVQNDDVEEHWGIVKGSREVKGGYYAAKRLFRNTLFRNALFSVSEYCRGTRAALERSALRKEWKEDIIVEGVIEKLQNQLNLAPSSEDIPRILEELAGKFFEKRGFDQFASWLKEYKSSYPDSRFAGLAGYYIALAGWTKLEYIADNGLWELYYAEKNRSLDDILEQLKNAGEKTRGTQYYLVVLYLEWLIHNDLLSGKESVLVERFEEELLAYAKSTGNITPLLTYSELLQKEGEIRLARKLLREYGTNVAGMTDADKAKDILKEKAEDALKKRDADRAKILYDIYLDTMIKNYSEEEASFAILELGNLYGRNSLYGEAIETYQRLTKEFPKNGLADDAAYAICLTLKEKRSYSKAIKALHDFILDYPASDLAQSAIKETLSIFTVYSKGTKDEKTVAFLKEIIALYPESDFSIMVRFELASSLASLGRREDARREYQYIIDNYPDSEYAKYSRRGIDSLGK